MAEPVYFRSPAEFRDWLNEHAASATELSVGFMKRGTGMPSMTWPESVDEALCVGWIDGVRHRVDNERYKIRFTPRKKGSTWSAVNIARIAVLRAEGRLQPAGEAAFERRIEGRVGIYTYEQDHTPDFNAAELKRMKQHKAALAFFEALPPSHRKRMLWWLHGARQAATRERRFELLLQACIEGRRL